jgi:hypothetical protein
MARLSREQIMCASDDRIELRVPISWCAVDIKHDLCDRLYDALEGPDRLRVIVSLEGTRESRDLYIDRLPMRIA